MNEESKLFEGLEIIEEDEISDEEEKMSKGPKGPIPGHKQESFESLMLDQKFRLCD